MVYVKNRRYFSSLVVKSRTALFLISLSNIEPNANHLKIKLLCRFSEQSTWKCYTFYQSSLYSNLIWLHNLRELTIGTNSWLFIKDQNNQLYTNLQQNKETIKAFAFVCYTLCYYCCISGWEWVENLEKNEFILKKTRIMFNTSTNKW